jgi:hypothetical protein
MDELIGDNTALTNRQFANLIADHRRSAEEQIEAAEIEATRKEVDELRGEDQEATPDVAAQQPAEPESEDVAIEKALKIPKLSMANVQLRVWRASLAQCGGHDDGLYRSCAIKRS